MAYTRRNVWKLGGDWAEPILWYARGVARMKARALDEPTGWRFFGAMHGIDPQLWQQLGYLSASDPTPPKNLTDRLWNQCQHGSWFFLPWHRGYLLAFEAIIRAEIAKLPQAPADWALPYWNYFNQGESALPPAFGSPNWPDGQGNNPLFVAERYGPNSDGNVFVPVDQINLKAMTDPDFTGVTSGGSPGFGGVDTGFEHGGRTHGAIETQPHDWVHGLVGGSDAQQLPGLMSDPDTAGLDPIFWLHHANIDRLWEVWRQNPPTNVNPPDQKWLKGPASLGAPAFLMPMPDGTTWDYTPANVVDLGQLGYSYDDLSPAIAVAKPSDRLIRLGATAAVAKAKEGVAMTTGKNVEMVGASAGPLEIRGSEARAAVQMNKGVRQKMAKSLAMAPETASPDRVFLNLENIRGLVDATSFHVYVGLPDGANPADHPELLAGSISLFGVRKATAAAGEHAGQGLTFVLDITNIVDALHLQNALDVDSLNVRIVPVRPVPHSAQIRIGGIRIFRQGL